MHKVQKKMLSILVQSNTLVLFIFLVLYEYDWLGPASYENMTQMLVFENRVIKQKTVSDTLFYKFWIQAKSLN